MTITDFMVVTARIAIIGFHQTIHSADFVALCWNGTNDLKAIILPMLAEWQLTL